MALDSKMKEAFNKQINDEMFSAYLYLSMGSWFEERNLMGFAYWFRCQYLEEHMHSMKMYNFVNERGERVHLEAIEAPKTEWGSIIDVFEEVYEHEKLITSKINTLVHLARELNDFASESFLMWYIDEQVEEEATVSELLTKLKMINNDMNGIFTIDGELKTRGISPNVVPIHLGQPIQE